MVVGKYQAFGTNHDTGTEVAEIHHAILQAFALGIIELQGIQLQAQAFHYIGCPLVDVVQHPHTLVGTGNHAAHKQQGEKNTFHVINFVS